MKTKYFNDNSVITKGYPDYWPPCFSNFCNSRNIAYIQKFAFTLYVKRMSVLVKHLDASWYFLLHHGSSIKLTEMTPTLSA